MTKKVPAPLSLFNRLTRNFLIGLGVIFISLGMGMVGYHHFEEMSWIDSYLNASMILSGMGPVSSIETSQGKIFAGTYALFCGIIFLVAIAIVFVPVFHKFFHKFHLKDENEK